MPKRPDLPCAECGRLMWRSTTSLPEGQAVCRPCRRKRSTYTAKPPRSAWEPQTLECPICRGIFKQDKRNQVYCSTSCRESRRNWSNATKAATAEERGYGKAHREERARWKPIVDAGRADCCICGYWIQPGTEWHLDHTEDRTGYRGAAHAVCNRRDGASRGARRSNAQRRIEKRCDSCHQAFVTAYPKQRYCSRECRPKPEAKPALSPVRFIQCGTCGQLFTSKYPAKYCPDHRGYQERTIVRPCATCGVEMECKQGPKRYCSKRCRPSTISGAQQRKRRRLAGGVGSISAA